MRRAFTLIELLVVCAVLAVLIALAVPTVQGYIDKGRATACMQTLRQLGAALNLYLGENNGIMPTLKLARKSLAEDEPVIDNTLDRYVATKKVFACPADVRIAKATGTSYFWNNAVNGQSVSALHFFLADQPTNVPLMGDKEGFHHDPDHKVNILYADGHASKELTFVTEK
jgi:prepilin-type N-terminal cleavage/methylation domain-containing protein/prepilin-type processing-associated H-X9-DG protein